MRLASRQGRISNLRLAVFVAGLVITWPTLGVRSAHPAWLLPPATLFVVLVVVHDRVIRTRERADRRVAYYEAGLARLSDDGGDVAYREALGGYRASVYDALGARYE